MACMSIMLIVNTLSVFAHDPEHTQVEEIPGRWSVQKARVWYDKQPWLIGCNFLSQL